MVTPSRPRPRRARSARAGCFAGRHSRGRHPRRDDAPALSGPQDLNLRPLDPLNVSPPATCDNGVSQSSDVSPTCGFLPRRWVPGPQPDDPTPTARAGLRVGSLRRIAAVGPPRTGGATTMCQLVPRCRGQFGPRLPGGIRDSLADVTYGLQVW